MREAFGGALLMYILVPVLFVLVFFMAFIMRYASAYRASNYIISQIETCDANISNCVHNADGLNSLDNFIRTKYFYTRGIDTNDFCYIQNDKGTVYRVTLYVDFDVPLIGNINAYKVRSESKTIYNVYEKDNAVFKNGIEPCNK